MKYTDNSLNILTALQVKGIGKGWINQFMNRKYDLEDLISAIRKKDDGYTLEFFLHEKAKIEKYLEEYEYADGVIAVGDTLFPELPHDVKGGDCPVVLFYKGDISLLTQATNIAVIGVLNPTENIERRERAFVKALVEKKCCIVSGLAKGCDGIAHKQALESNGQTIAILPNSLKDITPSEHKSLAEDIVIKGGLLITEYYKEITSKKELVDHYIKRDRLQAMFSKAVCLAASYAPNKEGNDSGSRHAMGKAKDYCIPRYVMYNEKEDSNNPMFDLNRDLLRESDVKIITQRTIDEMSKGIKTTLF